jgi:hypothetical protein
MQTLKVSLNKINFVHHACDTLASKNHHILVRLLFGICVMLTGVYIAKTLGHHPVEAVAMAGDTVGYGIHGIGLIPFVEKILSAVE